jgi:hypothetical protein
MGLDAYFPAPESFLEPGSHQISTNNNGYLPRRPENRFSIQRFGATEFPRGRDWDAPALQAPENSPLIYLTLYPRKSTQFASRQFCPAFTPEIRGPTILAPRSGREKGMMRKRKNAMPDAILLMWRGAIVGMRDTRACHALSGGPQSLSIFS